VRDDGEVILGGARCDWCGGGVRRSGVVGFFLGRGLAPHSKCGRGQHWRCGVGGVVGMQAVSGGRRRCLGERILGLRLAPWVGHGGHHLSAERSWEFVECIDDGLVVSLGGGGGVPSSLSGVRPIIMVGLLASCVCIEHWSWVFSMSALCFNLLSCMGRIVSGLVSNSLLF
jgi:hypothetical protein